MPAIAKLEIGLVWIRVTLNIGSKQVDSFPRVKKRKVKQQQANYALRRDKPNPPSYLFGLVERRILRMGIGMAMGRPKPQSYTELFSGCEVNSCSYWAADGIAWGSGWVTLPSEPDSAGYPCVGAAVDTLFRAVGMVMDCGLWAVHCAE